MKPFVSVVMPIRNEANRITDTLTAVLAQDYPADRMEVIVVDGVSDDGTPDVVRSIAERSDRTVIILNNPARIVPAALNHAIRAARGEVIVRVDGHCRLETDYVRRCVEALARTGADNVGGVQRAKGGSLRGRAIAVATMSPFGVGNARFRYSERPGWVDTVYLGTYRRDLFDRIGGFDEELANNQDDDFNIRLTKAGGRIWLDPAIRVTYQPRESISALWRQYFRYGLYKVRVLQKSGWTSARHFVPAVFVVLLVAGVVGAAVARNPLVGLVVPAVYAVGAAGAGLISGRRDAATMLLLPIVFATLHVAYGTGFLAGLWRWRRYFGYRGRTTKVAKSDGV
jgi:succinoglycan biosynthesis protein ExoA